MSRTLLSILSVVVVLAQLACVESNPSVPPQDPPDPPGSAPMKILFQNRSSCVIEVHENTIDPPFSTVCIIPNGVDSDWIERSPTRSDGVLENKTFYIVYCIKIANKEENVGITETLYMKTEGMRSHITLPIRSGETHRETIRNPQSEGELKHVAVYMLVRNSRSGHGSIYVLNGTTRLQTLGGGGAVGIERGHVGYYEMTSGLLASDGYLAPTLKACYQECKDYPTEPPVVMTPGFHVYEFTVSDTAVSWSGEPKPIPTPF